MYPSNQYQYDSQYLPEAGYASNNNNNNIQQPAISGNQYYYNSNDPLIPKSSGTRPIQQPGSDSNIPTGQKKSFKITQESAYAYLNKHNIQGIFTDLTSKLVVSRPNEPIKFMINELQEVLKYRDNNYACLSSDELHKLKVIFFIGPPASGKTTQAINITRTMPNSEYVDIDRMLDEAADPWRTEIQNARAANKPIPDRLIVSCLEHYIIENGADKLYCVDGFPSTIEMAARFDHALWQPLVVFFHTMGTTLSEIENAVIVRRSTRRYTDSYGREVTLQQIVDRLKTYEERIIPLFKYYDAQGLIRQVEKSWSEETAKNNMLLCIQQMIIEREAQIRNEYGHL